jgi:hypothetical protein
MDNAPIPGQETLAATAPGPPDLDLDLDAVRARRTSLRVTCAAVRRLLPDDTHGAAPVPADRLLEAVTDLDRIWTTHTGETESADGMLAQILHDCPRLAPSVGRLRREHRIVAAELRIVEHRLAAVPAGGPADPRGVTHLLDAVEAHRRAGRELIYDAYHVDLGLGE